MKVSGTGAMDLSTKRPQNSSARGASRVCEHNEFETTSSQEEVVDLSTKREVENFNSQERVEDHQDTESQHQSEEEDGKVGETEKQSRRNRTMFSEWQLASLEWRFARNKYLTTGDRLRVAKSLKLNQLQVKTWFQNRRMKWKKQILATGGQKSPTKPKGRPRRDSIPPIDD